MKVTITQNLEINIIQHVMLSHTVFAHEIHKHLFFLNTKHIHLGYQYIYHKIYLKIEQMAHLSM